MTETKFRFTSLLLTGWISRVDDNESARGTMLTSGVQRPLKLRNVQAPVGFLVQIVWNLSKDIKRIYHN